MIDPRLETLRVLRDEETVTATAAALHLTPSTVSQQLRQLSADLDVVLLEPEGRRVRLTPAAHTLLKHADVLRAQRERAMAEIAEHREGAAGHLRVTGIATALAALVAPAAARLRSRHPKMTFELAEDPGEDRYRLLLAERTDIAVVIYTAVAPSVDDSRFEQLVLLEEPQDLLVPDGHPFAGRDSVSLAEAAGEVWLQAGDPRDQHQLLLSAAAAAGFTPHVENSAVEWSAVTALVAHGHGICLFPRLAPIPNGAGVRRVPLQGQYVPSRRLVAYVRRGSRTHPLIARGLDALLEVAAERRSAESI